MLSLRKRLAIALLLTASPAWVAGLFGGEGSLSIRLVPSSDPVSTCSETFELTLKLSNPSRLAIGGYQVFLRFPAAAFDALRFDAISVNGLVQVAGPSLIGTGFRACETQIADGWADGAGEDVVAVVATAFAQGTSGAFTEPEADLGRFLFRPKAAADLSVATFRLNEEDCWRGFDTRTRVFDPTGASLAFESPGPLEVALDASSPRVEGVSCQPVGTSVYLSWVPPREGDYLGFRLYRGDSVIATLPLKSVLSWEDRSAPQEGTLVYRVVVLLRGFVEGCSTSCTVERGGGVVFVRGEANRDGSLNLTDAIAILDHLFRGIALTCEDAGDVDDSGSLNLTDAVRLLGYLFQSGEPPAPPFPTPGLDPTSDALEPCQAR